MVFDFHTHTTFSDGINSPIELIRCATTSGYGGIGITDHASYATLDFIIENVKKDCELANKYWNIKAIAGVELTNIPAKSIKEMAKYAKDRGTRLVVVHGESIAEDVEENTNWEAANCSHVDILAHPGILTEREARAAAKNGIYIEITARNGHNLGNGRVVKTGRKAGVKFLINSDAHSHNNLLTEELQEKIGLGAGLNEQEIEEIFRKNFKQFMQKLGYS
ncbi:MAG: histidinol phosphate phosphatase domain-containing protein [Candidatus Humimicrobiaceae bacterium]